MAWRVATPSGPDADNPMERLPSDLVSLCQRQSSLDTTSSGSVPPSQTETRFTQQNPPCGNDEANRSCPEKWVDHPNEKHTPSVDNSTTNIDPQLFQEQPDLPWEHKQCQRQNQATPTHWGSVGNYRDIIDDLTIEIQQLREEIGRYKRKSPGLLRETKLFEIKIHDLSTRSKSDLETTLQDFVANFRPEPAKQNVRSCSHGFPESLYPQDIVLTDEERRRFVVQRLEQLFAAKLSGNHTRPHQTKPPAAVTATTVPVVAEAQVRQRPMVHQPPSIVAVEPAREAKILHPDQQFMLTEKSILTDLQSEPGGDSDRIASDTNTPSPQPSPPEQRPTRLKDVDPARVQFPFENLEYIRHLGLAPPKRPTEPAGAAPADSPDADGWVSLNLLYNLAQLHMVNVTPDFVRMAVSEMSTKFQLSSDKHKLRWRGGWGGSGFASNTSADKLPQISEVDDDNINGKRQKTRRSLEYRVQNGRYSETQFKSRRQTPATSTSFHYKPLFGQQDSSTGQAPLCGMLRSSDAVEESTFRKSLWEFSPSSISNHRKRRRDGAITYYSGTPFYTDLSGDSGSFSAPTSMSSTGWNRPGPTTKFQCSRPLRSELNCSSNHLPLNELAGKIEGANDSGSLESAASSGSEDSVEIEFDLLSGDQHVPINVPPMEPCGLGGIMSSDCFMITVKTKRTNCDLRSHTPWAQRFNTGKVIEDIPGRLGAKAITSATQLASRPSAKEGSPTVEIDYMTIRIKRLTEMPLPPAIFFHLAWNNASPDNAFGSETDDEIPPIEIRHHSFLDAMQILHHRNA